jgi:ubiquinone/menaquinone biosynthesis C-methylase UbiE
LLVDEPLSEASVEYYERPAREYDATSWEHPGTDGHVSERVRAVLSSLPALNTLDVGCGTGYVSRWLPGPLTLMDTSSAMLSIARRRRPDADVVRAKAPPLPFVDRTFGRAFTANFFGHLAPPGRSELVREMLRVAAEVVVLEQLASAGSFSEGPEERQLSDGSTFTIHKCYFTVDRLLEEIGGGDVLMAGPMFAIIRRLPPAIRTG